MVKSYKKRLIIFSVLAALSVVLVFISLFLPIVRIVGHAADDEKTVVFDKSISFFQYFRENPFVTTAADEVYFHASGPMWLSAASILLNLLVGVCGVAMFVACLLEIIFCTKDSFAIKNNILAKKISLFVGWFTLLSGLFAAFSFMFTSMLTNGYGEFYSAAGVYLLMLFGLIIIVLAHLTDKRKVVQAINKLKNSIGFALVGILSALCFALVFVPQYAENFIEGSTSMWQVASKAVEFENIDWIRHMAGTYPFGFAQWVIIFLGIITAFLFIYSLIGFILAVCGKNTNWLSSRVKRWSMTMLIMFAVLYVLIMCQHAVLNSTFVIIDEFETLNFLAPQFFILIFVPFLPYAASCLISYNKKIKL